MANENVDIWNVRDLNARVHVTTPLTPLGPYRRILPLILAARRKALMFHDYLGLL